MDAEVLLLAALFLAAAALYASVGHAGASAYLAAMAIVGLAPDVMRPTALVLNLFVASSSSCASRAPAICRGATSSRSSPDRSPPPSSAARSTCPARSTGRSSPSPCWPGRGGWPRRAAPTTTRPTRGVPLLPGLVAGAGIGLLAGLTGTGGGIFLTPLLVLAAWTGTRDAAGLSGAFILANSVAGLAGSSAAASCCRTALPLWIAAVAAGGLIGSWVGASRFSILNLRRALAVVLVIAAAKLVFLP